MEYNEDKLYEENGKKRELRGIASFMPKLPERPVVKPKGGINSPFNDAVSRVCDLMKDKRFGYWCGRLRGLTGYEVDAMLSVSRRDGKNPAAYFNFLLKKKREQLSTTNVDTKPKGV